MSENPNIQFADLGFGSFRIFDSGIRQPMGAYHQVPVLLIHGTAANLDTNWTATGWVRYLVQSGYRVIAMDVRGHGHSPKSEDPRDYSLDILASDMCELLDYLKIDCVDVVGYSMGARISMHFAADYPERVRRLVLGGTGKPQDDFAVKRKRIAEGLRSGQEPADAIESYRIFRAYLDRSGEDLEAVSACMIGTAQDLSSRVVCAIKCQTLIVAGGEDRLIGSIEALAIRLHAAQSLLVDRKHHLSVIPTSTFKEATHTFLSAQVLPRFNSPAFP